ncbi:hypothetical protein [Sinomicrobium soli]|uniref:hypothetical protein n=1 Tax=Sinomicrobium sp. N-1-3-6 TaxID=2219864 RepID=UPI000DCDE95F|nr:hypothetical protein [Sinomicrobium sp. N-1-3-6]RAV28251.1 hypothetical protein DN748_13890 [Sinomicrobium sp. N-1-3-6]
MVTFYLWYTQKVLAGILILFFGFIGYSQTEEHPPCGDISGFLDIELAFQQDTIAMGEKVECCVKFINTSSEAIEFYPKGVIRLIRPFVTFGTAGYPLNDTIDVRKIIKLKPLERYEDVYDMEVEDSFFKKGENKLRVHYLYRNFTKEKEYDQLCGVLMSKEVNIVVVDPM